jgi:putative oxidoreductase
MLNLALLIPRVIIGLLFIGHGTQKLFGWFSGHGIPATAGFFAQIGIRPAHFWAIIAALFETIGGVLLALGLATPIAAGLIAAVMLTAIVFVHFAKGIWSAQGGIEYPLVLIAASALYGLAGAGTFSLDAYLGLAWPTPALYAAVLIVAVLVNAALRFLSLRRMTVGRQSTATAAV